MFAETLIGSAAQGSKSIGKYLEDGNWDLMDTAQTGVDVAVVGLSKIVFGVTALFTYGVVSEETLGIDAQNMSDGLKELAKNVGKNAGQYIVDHPEMNEKYQNGNCFDRIGLTIEATFKSLFRR